MAFITMPVYAADITCQATNVTCIQSSIATETQNITEPRWKNQSYRDLAVSIAFAGDIDHAINYIKKIDNSDTQAMTIRAIGMTLAIHKELSIEEYQVIFKKLNDFTPTIIDEGARDIAYTYIAMAQAFAGLDDDAHTTTLVMKKSALKHKAYGETAEIQAERGDFTRAVASINAIDSISFRNKALGIVSAIFLKSNDIDHAYKTAVQITNPTKKANALQKIVNAQIGLDAPK
jgi:hypothetical protein